MNKVEIVFFLFCFVFSFLMEGLAMEEGIEEKNTDEEVTQEVTVRILIVKEDFKLFLFDDEGLITSICQIAIGKKQTETPEGVFQIITKEEGYYWQPTKNQRKEFAKQGIILPKLVAPKDPNNPWGSRRLGLDVIGNLGYRIYIHETNKNFWWSIGQAVSTGCVRILPKDMDLIFPMAKEKEWAKIVKSVNDLELSLAKLLKGQQ